MFRLTRFTLPATLTLTLATLAAAAPPETRARTGGDYLRLPATEQLVYLAGAMDVLADYGLACEKPISLGEFTWRVVALAQSRAVTHPLIDTLADVLKDQGCAFPSQAETSTKPKA
jgi:hypothetical protein